MKAWIVDDPIEAAQSGQQNTQPAKEEEGMDGFMNIPDGIDESLPFV